MPARTRWTEQAQTAYVLDPATGEPSAGLDRTGPCASYPGGTLFSLDGTTPKWLDVPRGTTHIKIRAQGGGVHYEINGVSASTSSPGYVPEDMSEVIGPLCNVKRLWAFSSTAGTGAHVTFLSDGHAVVSYGGPWWDPHADGLNVWAVYAAKGAASFAASLLDLSGNGHDAGDPGGTATPGWDAVNGWQFGLGAAQYLTTAFVPQNDQSQSVLVQFTNVTVAGALFGADEVFPAVAFYALPDFGAQHAFVHGSALVGGGAVVASGNLGIAGNQGYLNGVADLGPLAGYGGNPTTRPVYVGCINNGGAFFPITAHVQAVAIYGSILTAAQVAAVAGAMAGL